MSGKPKVGIYARVSTRDKQEAANQLRELRTFAGKQGWKLVDTYVDQASGTRGPEARPEFARMFEDAERRKFDLLLFWSLDRFSREGARETLNHLNRLELAGVKYRSYTQPYFDTAGPFAAALISILAALAAQEQIILSDRVRAGMRRAAASGVIFGRPRRVIDLAKLYDRWKQERASFADLAAETGVSKATIFRRLTSYERSIRANADQQPAARARARGD